MQPSFHCVANIGDAAPLIHGGAFVLVDRRSIHAPELVILDPYGSDEFSEPTNWQLYSVICGRLTRIKNDKGEPIALSDNRFHTSHPVWWGDEGPLASLASSLDSTLSSLFDRALSSDPIELAFFYRDLTQHHGLIAFDSEPRELSRKQAKLFCSEMQAQINQATK